MQLKHLHTLTIFLGLCSGAFAADGADLVLTGGKVYPSPTATGIENAVVVIHKGKIAAVGKQGEVHGEKSAEVIDCTGKVIVAGFWNSHVHFETGWEDATNAPAGKLEAHMQEMLTRWGFTTVWDLGSDPNNTLALRRRVEAGEVPGPRILMAGDIFPKNGHPVYLPAELQLPEAATPQEAEQMAQVPGGRATPKSEWRTGDSRGKPQAKRAKKHKRAAAPKAKQP